MPETSRKIALASRGSRRAALIFATALAALFAASTWFTKFNPLQVISAQEEFWSFILTDFVPPYMGRWRALIDAVLQTLYMALSSAGISAALSLVLAFLGTPGVCRFRAVNAAVRGFASIIRNIPAMVWVFILVGAYGIGTEVGVLSLIIGTTGYLTRSYIETLDEVAERNLEPLKAAGAGILPTISQAILPAAAPGLIAWFLYCIELNIRASAIIGMVGAGGIGLLMMGYIKQYNYAAASTAILAVAVIVIAVNLLTDWLRKIILRRRGLPTKIFIAVSALATIASLALLRLDFVKIAERTPRLGHVFAEMAKLSTEKFSLTAMAMAETVAVSILSLIYGLILGLILGALSARNITPLGALSAVLKSVFSFIRAVPTAVWTLLALASMGFGMAAGIVGLLFHCTAFFSKVFAQIFEEVPEETIDAVRSTGARRLQVFFGAVLPASLSNIIAWTSLRFETNYVEAAILGMVGAGGIGYTMTAAMSGYKYGRAGLAVIIVFAFALAIELLTTFIKRKLKVD